MSAIPPQAGPLHATFEDAGVLGAMRRLSARLRVDYADACGGATLPAWIESAPFEEAACRCDPALGGPMALPVVMELVRLQRRLRQIVDCAGAPPPPEPPQPARLPTGADPARTAAIVRLCHGELLEAYARRRALLLCDAGEVPLGAAQQAEFAQLCADAGLVAVWTSAHAEYLATLDEVTAGAGAGDLMVPPPELHTVPNAWNGLDLTALYERAAAPRACPKAAQGLLAILTRATNAGSRGWESTLEAVFRDSDGAVRVCMHAIGSALAGLHPCLHPAARRGWPTRLAVARRWRLRHPVHEFRELVKGASAAIKEVMRLQLAMLLAEDAATLEALASANLAAGQLSVPPRTVAPTCMQAAMHALAGAGAALAAAPDLAPSAAINAELTSEPRSRKKTVTRPAPKLLATTAVGAPAPTLPLSYCCSWLGGRCGPAASALCPAVAVVASLLSASFRADYVPFWLHSHQHGMRASRLDLAQYRALHGSSAAHRLCAALPAAAALRAQRVALTVNDASLLTVDDALELLGVPAAVRTAARRAAVECASRRRSRPAAAAAARDYEDDADADDAVAPVATSSAASRAVQDAEQVVLGLDARSAALLLVFARACALRSQMLAYDLGPTTRARQAEAVCRRLLIAPAEGESHEQTALTRLPAHCTTLFACSECRRVVNACQNHSGKDVAFNELGLAASMLRVDGAVCDGHMRCAKRSSAALRTAVALEEAANAAEVETRPVDPAAATPSDLRPASVVAALGGSAPAGREAASEVAKLRRDIKNCYEQHPSAVACGDVPLVRVPILGRAVRIFDEWHALCAFCGCLARVTPASRFLAEPCCLRCDFAMLHGKAAAQAMQDRLPKPPPPACRYCGRCARASRPRARASAALTARWCWQAAAAQHQRALEDDRRARRHGRAQRDRPAAAARGLVLCVRAAPAPLSIPGEPHSACVRRSDPLALVADQRAQGAAHARHLCAHPAAGAAHVRRGPVVRRWRPRGGGRGRGRAGRRRDGGRPRAGQEAGRRQAPQVGDRAPAGVGGRQAAEELSA